MAEALQMAGYDVLATLGHGARSVIYKVRDPVTQGIFALKHVVRELIKDVRYLEQVMLEHEVASKLDHPTLRRSYKMIKQRSFMRLTEVFLVMELVEGVSLDQKRMSSTIEFCRVLQDAAIGLGVMHESGYVHSDIKPNNIMITAEGKVKIIDFGQSCPLNTIKERIQGTPDFIAPEQVKRHALTAATDVFGLGATLYWLLTGRHFPTMIPRKPGLGLKSDLEARAPHEINPNIPLALSTLTMKCVSKDPSDRPSSMSQVYERLEFAIAQLQRQEATGNVRA